MDEKNTNKKAGKPSRTVVFFHPDLGIGGAERLVVDAAVGLQERGVKVVVFTNHCDPAHCFDEARDGTLDVRVRGSYLVPRSILGHFTILCAILRQYHLLIHIYMSGELDSLCATSIFVDQLSAGLPLLHYYAPDVPILFYCHFPDLLLAHGFDPASTRNPNNDRSGTDNEGSSASIPYPPPKAASTLSPLRRLYRAPFDAIEGWSMSLATAVVVNSSFTKSVVQHTWPDLAREVELRVVHPCVAPGIKDEVGLASSVVDNMWKGDKVILSINRFERKKDIGLAIRAFATIAKQERENARLVIAGGYDPRVQENIAYHCELEALCVSLSLPSQTFKSLPSALAAPPASEAPVLFLHSVPSTAKFLLISRASLLVYTPANEHFGIVPLEAMAASVPVLAASCGGPTETVVDGETGWLRDTNDPAAWAEVIAHVVGRMKPDEHISMGRAGAERVRSRFQRSTMAERLDMIMQEMEDARRKRAPWIHLVLNAMGIFFLFGMVVAISRLFFKAEAGE